MTLGPVSSPPPLSNEKFYFYEATYPFLKTFLDQKEILVEELRNVYHEGWVDWPEKNLYSEKDHWTVYPFFGFETWIDKNCERCPETTRLLKQTSGLRTALYSRLGPGAQLKPHYGWGPLANGVLRCHLGLIVPEKCGIWVEGEFRTQHPGKWLVFDDSKLHSGFNFSNQDRVVLLIDIKRPPWVPEGKSEVSFTTELTDLVQKFTSIL